MSTILSGLDRQTAMPIRCGWWVNLPSALRRFASHGGDFSWNFCVVAYEQFLATHKSHTAFNVMTVGYLG